MVMWYFEEGGVAQLLFTQSHVYSNEQRDFQFGVCTKLSLVLLCLLQVDYFKEQLKAINARPIKKIAEAMAKKKVKAVKKWEQLKNKAQSIADNPDAAPSSKLQQIQKLYSGKDTPWLIALRTN